MGEQSIFDQFLTRRQIFLKEEIDGSVATKIAADLMWLDQIPGEITMYINSNGGDLSGLFLIYDTMLSLNSPVKTVCLSEAYSSAAVLLMTGAKGKRFAHAHSKIMIHSIQISDLSGSQSQILQSIQKLEKDNDTLMEMMAKHTGKNLKKIKKDCLEDKYFSAVEAVKYGIIDEIILPRQ